jgi:hypothetical protein
MFNLILTVTICLAAQRVYAQDQSKMDSAMMDFWVGTWDLTWEEADGIKAKGRNHVYKILADQVIFENFEALSGVNKGFTGKSWSVYNRQTGRWKQTWVDNQGAYLDFTGSRDGDRIMFSRLAVLPGGKNRHARMVFYDFREDGFTWDWEFSADEGATWTLAWRIHYLRKE